MTDDRNNSEVNEGTECDAQIVMRAAPEIHLVAHFQPQAQESGVPFDADAGIKDGADIIGAKIVDGAEEISEGRGPRVESRIEKAALQNNEGM